MVAELARRGAEAAQLTSYPELQNKLHALKALQQAHSDLEKGHSDLQQVCEELRHDKTTLQQEAEALQQRFEELEALSQAQGQAMSREMEQVRAAVEGERAQEREAAAKIAAEEASRTEAIMAQREREIVEACGEVERVRAQAQEAQQKYAALRLRHETEVQEMKDRCVALEQSRVAEVTALQQRYDELEAMSQAQGERERGSRESEKRQHMKQVRDLEKLVQSLEKALTKVNSSVGEGGGVLEGSVDEDVQKLQLTEILRLREEIEHKKKGMGTAAGEEPPLTDQKPSEVGVLTDLNPPAPSDAGGGGGSGDARARTPESRGSGWMQGAEEAEALEAQVEELHDLVECLEEERDGLSRSNRSLSARVRELETALVGATAMAQDLSSKHATMHVALAAANRRIDLLLCVDEAAGEGAAEGGDVDLATRARQLFELYQKTLSDYEALVRLFVCGVCMLPCFLGY